MLQSWTKSIALRASALFRFLRRNPGIGAALGLGLAVSFALFIVAERRETNQLESLFRRQAQDRVTAIAHELEERLDDLQMLGLLCGSKQGLTLGEFEQAAAQLRTGASFVQAFEWVLRVPRCRREEFEQAARHCPLDEPAARHAFAQFQLTELGPDGSLLRAAEREEYYPVYYVEPCAGNESALGFDLASEPLRQQFLSRALTTGRLTATPGLRLLQQPGPEREVLFFLPVSEPQASAGPTTARTGSTNQIRGLVLQAIRVGDFLEFAVSRLKHVGIDLLVFDRSVPGADALLHAHWSPVRRGPPPSRVPAQGEWREGLYYEAPLAVADRQWLLVFKPTSVFLVARRSWVPEGLLAAGLLLTAMLTGYLSIKARRAAQLAEANQELVRVNEILQLEIAERRRVEQALRLPLFAMDHAGEAIFWVDAHARFTYVNEAACRLLGYPREQLLTLAVYQVEPERPGHTWPARWEEYRRHKTLAREAILRTKNGSGVAVELTVNHFEYEGQEHNCTFARDITQRKQAEEALRAAEQRWRTLFEDAPDACYLHDLQGVFIHENKAAEQTIGYSREELIGHSFLQLNLLDPEQLPKAAAGLARNVQGQPTGPEEFLLRRKDGRRVPVEIRTHPVRVASQVLVLGIARDISERKEAEAFAQSINVLLQLLARKMTRQEYLDEVVQLLTRSTGCRCVGIRILDHEGFIPYESYVGFSQDFWQAENRVCITKDRCACTRVVTGQPEPSDLPVRTPAGSFHCLSLQEFARGLSAEERLNYRGLCIQEGFESILITPIRHREQTLGSIHLADQTAGALSPRKVDLIETMAPLIGEALRKLAVEEEVGWHAETQAFTAALWRLGAGPAGLEETLKQALGLIQVFPWGSFEPCGGLYLAEPDGGHLALVAQCGELALAEGLPQRVPVDQALCQPGSPLHLSNASTCPVARSKAEATPRLACVPLISAGQVFGALTLTHRPSNPHPITKEHQLLLTLADQLAAIIQRRRAEAALRESEAQLRTSLQEKEILLKEVHHRVKNNLQVISSLLELQAGCLEQTEPLKAFEESQLRVRTLAMVHEKLYQSADLAHIDFAGYAQSLTALLLSAYGPKARGVTLELEVDSAAALNLVQAIPCGLIINELVSNALKHAFPSRPGSSAEEPAPSSPDQEQNRPAWAGRAEGPRRIHVGLRRDPQHWFLSVRDNGVGLPASIELGGVTSSLGMTIVRLLVRQLGGSLEVSRQGGTAFTIRFPHA